MGFFVFCFFLIVFIHLFPQKSASIYWKHLNTNKAKELKKKNHNRMKISTPAKIHKDETGCFIIQTGLRNIRIAKLLVSKAPAGVLHQTSVTYICNLFMFVSLPCTSLMTEVFVFSFRSSKRFPGAFLSFSFVHTFFFLVRGEKEGTCCLNIPVQCVQPPSPLHCDYFMCKFCKRSCSVLWHTLWSHCGVPGFGDECSVETNKHDCQIFPAPY